jgi:hypothetical protein
MPDSRECRSAVIADLYRFLDNLAGASPGVSAPLEGLLIQVPRKAFVGFSLAVASIGSAPPAAGESFCIQHWAGRVVVKEKPHVHHYVTRCAECDDPAPRQA